MSQVYSRTIKAIGDIDVIYDRLWATMKAKGFNIIASEKPNLIVGERGSLRPTRKAYKFPHSVVVAFHSAESNPFISFSYIMSDFWDYTPGDQDFFNSEINSVISTLNMNSSVIELRSARDIVSQASQAYIGELRGLAKLRDDGVISTDEFEFKKKRLMGI
jgi:hypothetical protein